MFGLELNNLSYRYADEWAVKEVTARLGTGITGLLGPNGAGKTTLMRLSLGLLSPSEGQVWLLGGNPFQIPSLRLNVGYLPQRFDPPLSIRVGEYLQTMALLAGLSQRDLNQKVTKALMAVGLEDRRGSALGTLSGGMVRRVGVAQALIHEPKIMIMDEPAVGLDPEERNRLYEVLRAAAPQSSILISSHQVEELEREAESVWIISKGRLAFAGSVYDALRSVSGSVRMGVLPPGIEPQGRVVEYRTVKEGVSWRIVGEDARLAIVPPTLRDVYMLHVSAEGAGKKTWAV